MKKKMSEARAVKLQEPKQNTHTIHKFISEFLRNRLLICMLRTFWTINFTRQSSLVPLSLALFVSECVYFVFVSVCRKIVEP